MTVRYKKQKNGTLKLIGKTVKDYTQYWESPDRSTLIEQRYNVHGYAPEGITKSESILQPVRGNTILEIGCAPASFLKLAKEKGFDAEGIEPDKQYIEEMQKYSGCKIHEGYFPLKLNKKYDTIVAMDVFEHIEDGQNFIDECRKILNPNGVIIFMLPLVMNDKKFDDKNKHPEHVWLYSENHIKEWLKPIVFDRWIVGHEIIVFN